MPTIKVSAVIRYVFEFVLLLIFGLLEFLASIYFCLLNSLAMPALLLSTGKKEQTKDFVEIFFKN
jgi:hypothetical protein